MVRQSAVYQHRIIDTVTVRTNLTNLVVVDKGEITATPFLFVFVNETVTVCRLTLFIKQKQELMDPLPILLPGKFGSLPLLIVHVFLI